MRERMVPVLRFALVACLWLVCARLSAQAASEPPHYREAIDEALNELSAHHYEEARALFARAHALYPNARTLRGLGFTEFELRHYVACVEQLEHALESRERPLEGSLRVDTERLLARAKQFVGHVRIEARPSASELLVDGVSVPDAVLMLDAGQHQVELRSSAGYAPERRTLTVGGGERQTLTVVFAHPLRTSEREDQPRKSWTRSPWLWSAVGLAVAGAAVGSYFALRDDEVKTADPYGGSATLVLSGGH